MPTVWSELTKSHGSNWWCQLYIQLRHWWESFVKRKCSFMQRTFLVCKWEVMYIVEVRIYDSLFCGYYAFFFLLMWYLVFWKKEKMAFRYMPLLLIWVLQEDYHHHMLFEIFLATNICIHWNKLSRANLFMRINGCVALYYIQVLFV
mgnify:CR=1 FL=1